MAKKKQKQVNAKKLKRTIIGLSVGLSLAGVTAIAAPLIVWKKNKGNVDQSVQYTITYEDDFDSSSPEFKTDIVKSGEKAIMPLPKHRDNNGFIGWKEVKDDGSDTAKAAPYFDFMNTPITKDLKLYAHWKTEAEATKTGELTDAWIPAKTEGKLFVSFNYVWYKEHTDIIDIILPDKINGVPVDGIAEAGFNPTDAGLDICPLHSISLPDNITILNDFAFFQCCHLKIINMPKKLRVIGRDCFWNCYKLSHIQFNEGLEYIGDNAFGGGNIGSSASYLKEIKMPSTLKYIGEEAFSFNAIQKLDLSACTQLQLAPRAFRSAVNLLQITLPPNLTCIPEECFYQCTRLRYITIPKTVTYIDDRAFCLCYRLRQVIIEDDSRLLSIGQHGFKECHSLESFYFPGTIKSIGPCPFPFCENLQTVGFVTTRKWNIYNNGEWIEEYNFESNPEKYSANAEKIKEFSIPGQDDPTTEEPNSIIVEPAETADNIQYLTNDKNKAVIVGNTITSNTNITIPATITHTDTESGKTYTYDVIGIADSAFANNKYITGIKFGENEGSKINLEYILDSAFKGCSNIKTVNNFSNCTNLSYIGNYAFDGAPLVDSSETLILDFVNDNIPVTYIGDYAFEGTNTGGTLTIILPKELTYLGTGAFLKQKNLTKLDFTACTALKEIGKYTDKEGYCSPLISDTANNVKIDLSKTKLTCLPKRIFQGAKNLKEIQLPDSIAVIYDYAFYECQNLTSITIPKNCLYITAAAFDGAGLASATFADETHNKWYLYIGPELKDDPIDVTDQTTKPNLHTYLTTTYKDYNWVKYIE